MNKIILKFGVFDDSCYLCTQILHQEWRKSPPTGLLMIVGSGGKKMRVRIIDPLKINDYGNQED